MIGYYVHHHGLGHLQRARAIAAHVDDEVVVLSSRAPDATDAQLFADWVHLPPDDTARPGPADDVTAGGRLHWVPLRSAGVADRLAASTRWMARARPRCVMVDVSVEAALAARLAGVPVVSVALPGDRSDEAHQLGFAVSQAVLAFWPRALYDPPWLHPHRERTHHLGALSRFDGRVPRSRRGSDVLVMAGTGGGRVEDDQLAAAARATGRTWRTLGGERWVADPWEDLQDAAVVVAHCGQNALAEIGAAHRPAVLLPQDRPFGEQRASSAALERAGVAVRLDGWPDAARWPDVLRRAEALNVTRWSAWVPGDAAPAAARVVEQVAAAGPPW